MVEAMNTLIQEEYNHSGICITVKVSRRRQKVEMYLENKGSGLSFFSMDLERIFGCNVGNEFGVMLRGKGPHKANFAYDIVRILSSMIYTDLIEYNIVGDTKAPVLRCILFISFHSIHIELRNTSGEKIPFLNVGIIGLVLMFRKPSNNPF